MFDGSNTKGMVCVLVQTLNGWSVRVGSNIKGLECVFVLVQTLKGWCVCVVSNIEGLVCLLVQTLKGWCVCWYKH